MPPQKFQKKRKSETPAPPDTLTGKRLKSSTEHDSQVKGSSSPSKKAGPCLSLDTAIVKPEEFVSEYALSLFTEVKDLQDFRVASLIFWHAYFAYQRGQTAENLDKLWTLVISKMNHSQFEWRQHEKRYRELWDYEHETLLKRFESKFQEYVDAWIASPAGARYKELLEESRYCLLSVHKLILDRSKKTKLRVLNANDITEIQDKKGMEVRKVRGIEWTRRQVYDLFQFLSEIAEDEEINQNVEGFTSMALNNEELNSLDKWFSADLDAVKAESEKKEGGSSWFSRLYPVCNVVMLNMLHMHFEFADDKGRKVFLSKQSIRDTLMRVPTPALKSGKRNPFPVSSGTLEEWIQHFEDTDMIRTPSPSPHPFMQEVNAIDSDIFSALKEGEAAASVQHGEDYNKHVTKTLMTEFIKKGGDPRRYTDQDFTNILVFPSASVNSTHLSEWTIAVQNSNLHGQSRLFINRLDNELLRVNLLNNQLARDRSRLLQIRTEYINKIQKYLEARQLMRDNANSWTSLREDNDKLDEMIAEFEKNPVLKSYMEREMGANAKSTIAHSPFQSPSLSYKSYFIIANHRSINSAKRESHDSLPQSSLVLRQILTNPPGDDFHSYINDVLNAPPPSDIFQSVEFDSAELIAEDEEKTVNRDNNENEKNMEVEGNEVEIN